MRYFEVISPYYALIKAENIEKAKVSEVARLKRQLDNIGGDSE